MPFQLESDVGTSVRCRCSRSQHQISGVVFLQTKRENSLCCLCVGGQQGLPGKLRQLLLPWPSSSVQEPVGEAVCLQEAKYLFLPKWYQRSFLCLSRNGAANDSRTQLLFTLQLLVVLLWRGLVNCTASFEDSETAPAVSLLSPSVTCSFAGSVPLQTSVKMTLNDNHIPSSLLLLEAAALAVCAALASYKTQPTPRKKNPNKKPAQQHKTLDLSLLLPAAWLIPAAPLQLRGGWDSAETVWHHPETSECFSPLLCR